LLADVPIEADEIEALMQSRSKPVLVNGQRRALVRAGRGTALIGG
jgi:hypothetical protein